MFRLDFLMEKKPADSVWRGEEALGISAKRDFAKGDDENEKA